VRNTLHGLVLYNKSLFSNFKDFFFKKAKAIKKIIRFRSKVYWKRLAFGTNGGLGFESPMTWRKKMG